MSQRYIGGLETLNPTPLNPALGNAANGIFSMSQYFSLKNQGLWPAIDPYFRNTTLLLHGNGTNGAQNNTFLDSSTNNFTITRNGNTTQGTFTPYGSNWSNYFDGNNTYLSIANTTALQFGTGDFTIESFVFLTATPSAQFAQIIGRTVYGSNADWMLQITNANKLTFYMQGSFIVTSTGNVPLNTWTHVAVSRSGSTVRLFINGTVDGTATNSGSTENTSSGNYTIGAAQAGTNVLLTGYLSNLRTNKGTAVYTSNFTPSTSPLTAITNTSLLTCQSNRFIDNSSNAFAITVNGSPSVQRFSPFNPSAPYAAGTIGGSGYFDGSGDYLLPASNAAFNFGTGDFTVEAWVYQPASGTQCVYDSRGSDASSAGFFFGTISTNFVVYTGGTSVISTAMPLNAWTHLAVARSGSTWTLYKNGVSAGTYSSSANLSDANRQIGASTTVTSSSANYLTGYISDLRVVKGTAVYTTTFTPPTAPLTAITNTSLLLNMTNGGIIDNAMMNDLETVGNAQISTTQSKFGGASMYFDGNGDYLTAATTPAQQYGTGNFTIEFWFYKTANGSYNYGDSTGDFFLRIGNTGFTVNSVVISTNNSQQITAFIGYNGSSWATTIVSSSTFSLDTWYHVALVRAGTGSNQTTLYVNGTSYGTGTSSTDLTDASFGTALRIGASSSDRYYNGYIDDLRITKGIARYTAAFTPQTSQWQDQ